VSDRSPRAAGSECSVEGDLCPSQHQIDLPSKGGSEAAVTLQHRRNAPRGHACQSGPRYNRETHALIAAGEERQCENPLRCKGSGGTPGGTRIPNLLIRSHTTLMPARTAQCCHDMPSTDFRWSLCRGVPSCTAQYHDVGLEIGLQNLAQSRSQISIGWGFVRRWHRTTRRGMPSNPSSHRSMHSPVRG
jgi:hypothetical protein